MWYEDIMNFAPWKEKNGEGQDETHCYSAAKHLQCFFTSPHYIRDGSQAEKWNINLCLILTLDTRKNSKLFRNNRHHTHFASFKWKYFLHLPGPGGGWDWTLDNWTWSADWLLSKWLSINQTNTRMLTNQGPHNTSSCLQHQHPAHWHMHVTQGPRTSHCCSVQLVCSWQLFD